MSNIYSPPSADVSNTGADDATYEPKLFSLKGRIGRLRMIAYGMGSTVILMLAMAVLVGVTSLVWAPLAMVFMVIVYIPMFVLQIAFSVRRLNDLNATGWWVLLSLVPLINIIFALYVLFAPGTKGSNEYGPAPSENPKWVVVCAWILPIVFILGIFAAVGTGAYQTYMERTATGSSESL